MENAVHQDEQEKGENEGASILIENDEGEMEQKECPEINANFFSRVTFWWLNALMLSGYRKFLEMSDLFLLRPDDQASSLSSQFSYHWNAQANRNNRSLLYALHKSFGFRFYMAGILRFIADVAQLSSPFFVKLIVDFVSNPDAPFWQGLLYALGLFLVSFLAPIILNQYIHIITTQGMKIRTALRAAIYKKSLKMSSEARREMSTGDIVNFMSIDAQKLCDVAQFLHHLWSGLFQIIVSIGFLFYFIGLPTFLALFVMIIVLPTQGIIARISQMIRKKMLVFAGERIKIINEILMGIRVIKFYAWENSFIKRTLEYRLKELVEIRQSLIIFSISSTIMSMTPLFVSIMTFALYALIGKELRPDVIFPALSYLNQIRMPLVMFPTITAMLVEAKISLYRIEKFLLAEDFIPPEYSDDIEFPIKITDGEFAWKTETDLNVQQVSSSKKKDYSKLEEEEENAQEEKDLEPSSVVQIAAEDNKKLEKSENTTIGRLSNINVKIKKNSLTAIIGQVGAGKSSFLSAIIGEMKQLHGKTQISSSIAYCPQQAWLQNCSVRDNILFGQSFDEQRYRETLRVCALESDLEILPAGDATEIGEKGINLSGGQRQRINLARAVYSNAETLLLDDILSAVDAHVGQFIFNECISGFLKDRARLLVTHQWQYLKRCDHILVLKDGKIIESGTYDEIICEDGFAAMLKSFPSLEEHGEIEEAKTLENENSSERKQLDLKISDKSKGKLISEEERKTGNVKFWVYRDYVKYAGGYFYASLLVLMFILTQVILIGNTYWLALWSEQTDLSNGKQPPHSTMFYLGIYLAFGVGALLLQLSRELLFAFLGLSASKNLHAKALQNIIHAPTMFFDTTPIGRIINRFSKDTESIDTVLVQNMKGFFEYAFAIVGVFIIITFVLPLFLVPLLPVLTIYYFAQQYYRRTSRELKRLESISRSPLFAFFSETLTGTNTIRAYGETKRFEAENEKKLDINNMTYFCQLCSQRWLSVRLEVIGSLVIAFVGLFCIVGKLMNNFLNVDGGLAGLVLTYALQITRSMNWAVRSFTDTEASMNSVERVLHYCEKVKQEAAFEHLENKPPQDWSQTGNITFKNIWVKYRQDLDYVLKGLNAEIYGSEKIGIVGRTGAGKSSLMTVLFRLVELDKGSILIDGVDISTIGLYDLRSKLSIIPQDAVLFSGTVRFNLDLFNEYSDKEIWLALERSHMKTTVESLPLQLSEMVAEYGENFSVGQRQLFCLARAILRQTKVLLLDEATASVDLKTDALIQQTVRQEFADRTVLTIAHRLNTIIDSDRIMVLDQGELVEFDTPQNLLDKPDGIFTSLCKQTGKPNYKYLKKIANGEISLSDELAKQLHSNKA